MQRICFVLPVPTQAPLIDGFDRKGLAVDYRHQSLPTNVPWCPLCGSREQGQISLQAALKRTVLPSSAEWDNGKHALVRTALLGLAAHQRLAI